MVTTANKNQATHGETGRDARARFFPPVPVQTKLTVNDPGDQYEQQADAVADKVIGMGASLSPGGTGESFFKASPALATGVQRKCKGCEEEEILHRKESGDSSAPPSPSAAVQQTLQSSGHPLDAGTRSFMEQRFGQDFGHVQIHNDPLAHQSSADIQARAYTHQNHIVFGSGQYQPQSEMGRHLLAHELTHVLQQKGNASLQTKSIQRDLAVDPTVVNPAAVVLTREQMHSAIQLNLIVFTHPAEIALVRDVLGISRDPAVIDENFVNALVQYQASYGLPTDGKLDAATAARLAQELTAEADFLGQPAVGTPLRWAARRLTLRSQVPAGPGNLVRQGFTTPDQNPDGIVTVRTGVNDPSFNAGITSGITQSYTGRDADHVRFLQFVAIHMSAVGPHAPNPDFLTGNLNACRGGPITHTWSTLAAPVWELDSCSATDPFYDASFAHRRDVGHSMLIADQPGGNAFSVLAQGFATTLAPAPATVTVNLDFVTYAVNDVTPIYEVRWSQIIVIDVATGNQTFPATGVVGIQVNALDPIHKTAVDARNPGNGIH